ncbi:MAG: hypothetical protein GXY34_15095 [Syntrophomonadaceae bacterium]|nr:hypothetical protein [Syntrophomonadaceae bacterium]
MKPLELRIKGLNSFRDEQVIDFRRLGEYSLFGIFGPTGSGKSSILDAIILALYGVVPRAGSGAAGTINQMEDAAEVAFRFELSTAEGRQEYLIQRRYRRDKNNPDSSHFASGRLTRIAEPEAEVLASKDSELKSMIVELLGLSAQDFTRAVVLPQGRFAEFLALKNRERTDMLERIFSLEQFGERLNRNLKNRLQAAASAMEILNAEMTGIGDASDNALELARSIMEQTGQEAAAAEEEENAARQHYESRRRVWELQEAYQEVLGKLRELQGRSEEITGLRHMADQARRADQTRPFLEAAESLGNAAEAAEREYQALKEEEGRQRRETEVLQHQLRTMEQAWQEEAPQIKARLEKLREILGLEEESREGHRRLACLQAELQSALDHLGQLQEQVNELERLKLSCEAEQERLSAIKRDLAVEPLLREQISGAMGLLQLLKQLQKNRINTARNLEEKARELQEAENSLAILDQAYEALNRQVATARQDSERLRDEIACCMEPQEYLRHQTTLEQLVQARKLERQIADRIAEMHSKGQARQQEYHELLQQAQAMEKNMLAAQDTLRELGERYQREQERHQAVRLAGVLAAGEPCPVCGSLHHPRPATQNGEDHCAVIEAEIKSHQGIMKNIESAWSELNIRIGAARSSLESQESLQEEAQQQMAAVLGSIAECQQKLPTDMRELDADDARRWIEVKKSEYEQQVKASRKLEQSLVGWERERGRALAEKEKQSGIIIHSRRLLSEISTGLERAIGEEEELTLRLEEKAGGLDIAALQEHERIIREKDRKTQELEMDWQSLANQTQKVIRQLDELRGEVSKRMQDVAVKKAEAGNLEQTLGKLDKQISEATQGLPVYDSIVSLEQRWQEMEQGLADLRHQAQQNDQWLEAALVNLTATRTRSELAAQRCQEAEKNLELALARGHFASAGEARAALVGLEEIVSWEDSIQQFAEEGKRLDDQKIALEESLQGQAVTRQEWEAAGERLAGSARNAKAALESRAIAQDRCRELEGKNRRWREIEQEQLRWQEENNRLQLLQSTLRGKDFVKFIAGEQLRYICRSASLRLQQLSHSRYALELDSENSFVIRDDHNGGLRRSVATLSGGETFLASLALALALSAQIQLRGQYPLEFFFLDEGFGTLDPDLLETVISSLESLRHERFMVGVISHVPELQNRLPRHLQVIPAEPGAAGTQLRMI